MESPYRNSERKILKHILDELIKNGKTTYNPLYICGADEDVPKSDREKELILT